MCRVGKVDILEKDARQEEKRKSTAENHGCSVGGHAAEGLCDRGRWDRPYPILHLPDVRSLTYPVTSHPIG